MPRSSGMNDREPCPWRIIDDVGGAFAMGCVGGGIWHIIKGARMAPKGARFIGGLAAVQARAPVLGGQFAVWGGIFASCDCTLTYYRQKEDPWNSIASGGITGGILAARAGPRAVVSAAVIGALLLALIEGMGIWLSQLMSPAPEAIQAAQEQGHVIRDVTAPPTAPTAASSFSLFGGGSSSSSSDPATTSPPPPSSIDISSDGTIFERENTSGGAANSSSSSGSSWWPFGGKD